MILILKPAISHFPQAIEKYGAGQSISGLSFVESDLHTAAQVWIFEPLEKKRKRSGNPFLKDKKTGLWFDMLVF